MPQRNHVMFDSLGNKGLFFGVEARWGLNAGVNGIFTMQRVAPHEYPSDTVLPSSELSPIGEPVVMQFEKPETIDSLIMQLKCQRDRLQMEINAKAAKEKEEADCAEASAQSILNSTLRYKRACLEMLDSHIAKMGVEITMVFLKLPQDFHTRLVDSIKSDEAPAKPKMTIEEMAACDTLGITADFYHHLRKSIEQAG